MISFLSIPTSGRMTGNAAAFSITAMFSSVCEATCPRLSPVTSTVACERSASALAIRSMKRR